MCLHPARQDAEDIADDDLPDLVLRLPERDDDYDWDTCDEVLFQDHDVRMLFGPEADGIEDPDREPARDFSTVNLHPRDWFTLFPNVRPRDPGRGVRREPPTPSHFVRNDGLACRRVPGPRLRPRGEDPEPIDISGGRCATGC